MTRLNEALRSRRTDEGFSLVEMVVAMAILALLSTGIAAGTGAVVKMTAETRSRQIAANLAEAQLDQDRGVLDPFFVHCIGITDTNKNCTTVAETTRVGNRTYTLTQATSLVSSDGTDITCGSGKTIYYRRISVSVTWTGMLPTTSPVQSDTILAPNGRINDSSTGSIAVQVTGSSGTGQQGVSVSVAPISGGTALPLQTQPAATDIDGCSYALGVSPGTYTVTVSRSGWVDTKQSAGFTQTVGVVAGRTSPVSIDYDAAVNYKLTYAGGASVLLPSALPVTFLSSNASPYLTPSNAAAPSKVQLYPYPAGWTAIAGAEADTNGNTQCASQDPAAWQAGTYKRADGTSVTLGQGMRGDPVAAAPGGSATLDVPMGTFRVNLLSGLSLTAVAVNDTTNGSPGCANPATYTFPATLSLFGVTAALPYGTYKITSGGLLGALTSSAISPIAGGTGLSTFLPASGTLVLDPRPVQ